MCAVPVLPVSLAASPPFLVLAPPLPGICDLWLLLSLETFGAELGRLLVETVGRWWYLWCLQCSTDFV